MPTNRLIQKEKVVAYARALFDGAQSAGGQETVLEVRDQAEQVLQFIRSSMDLAHSLENTSYSPEQRNEIVKNVFSGFNSVLVDVVAIMAERNDIDLLNRVWAALEDLINNELDLAVVDVTTAVELDDKLRGLITKKVESDLGKKVVLREHIDVSILGGIIMSANGKRIDASVLSQLESARSVLKTTTDGGEG